MNPDKQREIASKGGRAAHERGTAHEWTPEQAREAGRKGGLAAHQRRLSQDTPSTPEPQDASLTDDSLAHNHSIWLHPARRLRVTLGSVRDNTGANPHRRGARVHRRLLGKPLADDRHG